MEPTNLENPEVEHERRDVPAGAIAKFLVGLLVAAVVISVAMWGLLKLFEARADREDPTLSPLVAASLKRTPPSPRLEVNPLELKEKLAREEQARLESYRWVDRQAGTVAIPIEQAMEWIAERGVPGGKPMAAAPAPGAPAPKYQRGTLRSPEPPGVPEPAATPVAEGPP